ncbi:MAG: hypothetical protein AAF491_02015 [Verrucomicrobiota bacterium]
MEEEEKQRIEGSPSLEEEPQSVRGQLGALVVLLLVAGTVWLLFQYLPVFGDWLGGKANEIVGRETEVEKEGRETGISPPEPEISLAEVPPDQSSPISASRGTLDHFRKQLVEQLGGDSVVVVRHLALSDEEDRMVAAIAWKDGREPALAEVFFERDEFGRYLSSEGAVSDSEIKLWSE